MTTKEWHLQMAHIEGDIKDWEKAVIQWRKDWVKWLKANKPGTVTTQDDSTNPPPPKDPPPPPNNG